MGERKRHNGSFLCFAVVVPEDEVEPRFGDVAPNKGSYPRRRWRRRILAGIFGSSASPVGDGLLRAALRDPVHVVVALLRRVPVLQRQTRNDRKGGEELDAIGGAPPEEDSGGAGGGEEAVWLRFPQSKSMRWCCSIAALRTHHLFTFSHSISSTRRLLSKPPAAAASYSSNATLTLAADPRRPLSFQYGPSLRSGRVPEPQSSPPSDSRADDDDGGGSSFDRASFSRVYDVAALRVPAEECSALERRLRGHLLNWPRVRNVARIPGDDVDPEIRRMLRDSEGDGGSRLNSLAARADGRPDDEKMTLSPVLYREKLVKEFNFRGFLKFRNLAKMSRPKKKKVKSKDGVDGVRKSVAKDDFAVIEVIGEGHEEEGEDLSGLLGDDFKGLRWRGPTRLLLLDQRHAKKPVAELPEAIKAALNYDPHQSKPLAFELVQCQLTLSYDYWQMNEVVLDKNKPKIQTVVNKTDAIQNDYRTMQLEILAGNHSLVTTVVENGIRFQVDLGTVYWNSKLATERQRLIDSFTSSDIVCKYLLVFGFCMQRINMALCEEVVDLEMHKVRLVAPGKWMLCASFVLPRVAASESQTDSTNR
ncbi:hypothetical protein B296_00001279 [Ensete ventricosum]|uniref:SAM-dependent methyltransferase TRM5/TYW2-type domain-containing protein n=1 Tax=Ensete ventricosum TaxID=4639 RepID=A0A427AVF6_ENSVE|nr:hypothetical protein B296_00001279 [Ensete ventricosum]